MDCCRNRESKWYHMCLQDILSRQEQHWIQASLLCFLSYPSTSQAGIDVMSYLIGIPKFKPPFYWLILHVLSCVCVSVFVCLFPSTARLLLTEKNNKCNARDQAKAVVMKKWFCVKHLRCHAIDNYNRDLQASNCARVSIKPSRATINKRQLLKLSKNQR